jgi:hypothetical protein
MHENYECGLQAPVESLKVRFRVAHDLLRRVRANEENWLPKSPSNLRVFIGGCL